MSAQGVDVCMINVHYYYYHDDDDDDDNDDDDDDNDTHPDGGFPNVELAHLQHIPGVHQPGLRATITSGGKLDGRHRLVSTNQKALTFGQGQLRHLAKMGDNSVRFHFFGGTQDSKPPWNKRRDD